MFAVIEGSVDIIIRGQTVETVEAGGVFGEMALVEGRPRIATAIAKSDACLLYTSPSPRDRQKSRMPSSA